MTPPYPELPLPMRVTEAELVAGAGPLTGCEAYGSVHLLLRRHRRALGWVDLKAARPLIPAEEIQLAALRRLRRECTLGLALEALPPPVERSRPAISVIVCTRDRAVQLRRCLRAIAGLKYPRYEVIVVDNAPTNDATERVALEAGCRYVIEPCPGLDWARNRGIAVARHGIIAFTDDDTEVDPAWLEGIAEGFRDPAVGVVTGLVIPAALDTEAEVLFELGYGGMGKGTVPRTWDPFALEAPQLIGSHHAGVGANMAFRRPLLEQLGGFDTSLDVGTPANGAGDLDMFHRAWMAGAAIRYQPGAALRHYHRQSMQALRRQLYDNGRAFGVHLLTIFQRGSVPRTTTAWYALRIWLAWLVGRVGRRFLGRERLPLPLLLTELWGAAHAPWAWFTTRRRDRALRARFAATLNAE